MWNTCFNTQLLTQPAYCHFRLPFLISVITLPCLLLFFAGTSRQSEDWRQRDGNWCALCTWCLFPVKIFDYYHSCICCSFSKHLHSPVPPTQVFWLILPDLDVFSRWWRPVQTVSFKFTPLVAVLHPLWLNGICYRQTRSDTTIYSLVKC